MKFRLICGVMVFLLGAAPVLAATEVLQPVVGPVVKTPPLEDSDFSSAQFELIFGAAYPNWAVSISEVSGTEICSEPCRTYVKENHGTTESVPIGLRFTDAGIQGGELA